MRWMKSIMVVLLVLAFLPPTIIVCHATIAVPCCFGVVCPQVNGCDTHTSQPSDIN